MRNRLSGTSLPYVFVSLQPSVQHIFSFVVSIIVNGFNLFFCLLPTFAARIGCVCSSSIETVK